MILPDSYGSMVGSCNAEEIERLQYLLENEGLLPTLIQGPVIMIAVDSAEAPQFLA